MEEITRKYYTAALQRKKKQAEMITEEIAELEGILKAPDVKLARR
jgi:hypothetical protein